jgi:hypothetical protein
MTPLLMPQIRLASLTTTQPVLRAVTFRPTKAKVGEAISPLPAETRRALRQKRAKALMMSAAAEGTLPFHSIMVDTMAPRAAENRLKTRATRRMTWTRATRRMTWTRATRRMTWTRATRRTTWTRATRRMTWTGTIWTRETRCQTRMAMKP